MALDEASKAFVEAARQSATKAREQMTPDEAREATARMRAVMSDGASMRVVEDFSIVLDDVTLPARRFVPDGELTGLLVYYHGGGWVVGSLKEFDPLCREIAAATGCVVIAVQYRKAPEHPYPVPVEDAWNSLCWIAQRREQLADQSLPLLVGGDSAGGNLAIVVTMRARDRGSPNLAAQLLIYPVTDFDFDRASYLDPENQLSLTRPAMMWYWDHYAPDAEARTNPEVSPLRASDMSGLPPAVILTAEHDVLRDEGEAYAARLVEAGTQVHFRRFHGQLHAFAMLIGFLPGSRAAVAFIGDGIKSILATTPTGKDQIEGERS